MIQNVAHLLRARRFVPLFATQFLGAFNDSLFKQAVVLFVTYNLYSDPHKELQFSAIAQGLFILPFFLFSALSGHKSLTFKMSLAFFLLARYMALYPRNKGGDSQSKKSKFSR